MIVRDPTADAGDAFLFFISGHCGAAIAIAQVGTMGGWDVPTSSALSFFTPDVLRCTPNNR